VRAKTIAAVLALAAVAVLGLPGSALAKPGFYKVKASTTESIQTRAADGYRLSLVVFRRRLRMSVDKSIGHGGIVLTSYLLHRRLPAGPNLHFRLDKEADVDLRFVPDQVTEHEYPNCTGGSEITERGHFVGRFSFRGRDGFSRFDAHRVAGSIVRTAAGTCRKERNPNGIVTVGISGSKTGSASVPEGTLELIAGTGDRRINFVGYRFEETNALPGVPQSFGNFVAWIERREPTYTVSSTAFADGAKEEFVSPDAEEPLSAAKVSPGAPFSGSATFQMTSATHGEWSGDLAVELPGYGKVPLTGPKIAAGLCETKACTPTLPKSLRPRTSPGLGLEEGSGGGSFESGFFGG
jgi:hypothetical protein